MSSAAGKLSSFLIKQRSTSRALEEFRQYGIKVRGVFEVLLQSEGGTSFFEQTDSAPRLSCMDHASMPWAAGQRLV